MQRKQNFQTIAWFWDIFNRSILNLEPPYQRRSVWNQAYRDFYVDTILLDYPSPALFLFEQITLSVKYGRINLLLSTYPVMKKA